MEVHRKDFGAESWLFFVAKPRALIEKHESMLAEEEAEQCVAQMLKDIKADLADLKWPASDGKPDSMEWEIEMAADSEGSLDMKYFLRPTRDKDSFYRREAVVSSKPFGWLLMDHP